MTGVPAVHLRSTTRLTRVSRVVRRMRSVVAGAVLIIATTECADSNAVRVRLQAYTPSGLDARQVEIRAQVAGPISGLRYKWFSVAGESDPQESGDPTSVFTFASGTSRDRVSVEVWRGERRVAFDQIDVKLDEERAAATEDTAPHGQVTISTVLPYEAGGPDTHTNIAGTVTGAISPSDRIVIYARADVWYIQPTPGTLHAVHPDGSWSSWTHTGTSYAALLVRPRFDPLPRYDVLPQVGGHILARTVVEGTKR